MSLPFRYPDKPLKTPPETFAEMSPEELSQYIVQRKYDGWHMLAFIDSANATRCMSQANNPMEQSYKGTMPPELQASFSALGLPDDTVLDAEFVGPRGSHRQTIYIFDMLAWDGRWVGTEPFEVRWQRCLDTIHTPFGEDSLIQLAETSYPSVKDTHNIVEAEFNELHREWLALGGGMNYLYEGLVPKTRTGTLVLNRSGNIRSDCIFKIKFRDIDEDLT